MELLKSTWVDKYLLRYSPGTIFGAFFLAYLYFRRLDYGFPIETTLDKISIGLVFLIGGFVFAYVASAPILVFHVSRPFHLRAGIRWWVRILWLSFLTGLVFTGYILFSRNGIQPALSLVAACSVALWISTMILASLAIFRRKSLFDFYMKLCAKRSNDKIGMVESYRTMREHGNAFCIIYWEIFLASIIIVTLKLKPVSGHDNIVLMALVLALLWIWPASLIWYVAGRLETDFVDSKT
jgi:hypothetical protein